MTSQTSIQHKVLNIIKVMLIVFTFGFVFYKLYYAYHLPDLYQKQSLRFGLLDFFWLLGLLLLTVLNWFLESVKWKLLISKGEPMSLAAAAKGVLSGVALGLITPNQLGTFVGRIIHLKELSKVRGSLVSVIGNTAQMLMTMIFGIMATLWFLFIQGYFGLNSLAVLFVVFIFLTTISIYLFFHIDHVSGFFTSRKWSVYLDVFTGYNHLELTQVLLLSMFRYLIFVFQYLLLVHLFKIQIDVVTAMMCICGSLFIQAFVPSFILLDIGIRGAAALWLFGFYTMQATEVLLMTYTVWMANLMLPGLCGLYFILRWRSKS